MLKYHNFLSAGSGAVPPDPHIWDYLLGQTRTPLLKSLHTGLIIATHAAAIEEH